MAKTIYDSFKNVFSYAAGVEDWCRNSWDFDLEYTFCNDFALADWVSEKAVYDTYKNVIRNWKDDYKAFTEFVVSLNLLSWANDQLVKQGFTDREKFVGIYSDLYYKATREFYDEYKDNDEACRYFFDMTD